MSGAPWACALLLCLCAARAQPAAGPTGPSGGAGAPGGALLPTLGLAWGALGWAGLGWLLVRRGRPPDAAPGRPGAHPPGLQRVDGEPAAVLRGLLAGHRVLLVGPVPAGIDPSEIPSGTLFPMGDAQVPLGRLLRAKAQLEGRGPPLLVLLLGDPVDITGAPSLSLESVAQRRLRLPVLRLHRSSQISGEPLPDRAPDARSGA